MGYYDPDDNPKQIAFAYAVGFRLARGFGLEMAYNTAVEVLKYRKTRRDNAGGRTVYEVAVESGAFKGLLKEGKGVE